MFPLGLVFLAFSAPAATAPDYAFADELYKKRHVEANARQAYDVYRAMHERFPEDVGAAWRFAMASQFVGLRLTPPGEERETKYREGRDAALAALERDEKCGPCHFWAGIDMALYGDSVGALKMLFSLASIREHLKRSAEIDPKYAHAGAYRVLGLIEQKLPGILGGSNRRAREFFEKAIEAEPGNALNFLMLARLLAENLDDPEGANAVAVKALSFPRPPLEDIESHEAWEEIKAYRTPSSPVAAAPPTNEGS